MKSSERIVGVLLSSFMNKVRFHDQYTKTTRTIEFIRSHLKRIFTLKRKKIYQFDRHWKKIMKMIIAQFEKKKNKKSRFIIRKLNFITIEEKFSTIKSNDDIIQNDVTMNPKKGLL